MSDLTLTEAAEKSGLSIAVIRKDAQRRKLRTRKVDQKVVVDEGDLTAYMAGRSLVKLAGALEKGTEAPKALTSAVREVGNLYGYLPRHLQQAILDGIPHSNKGQTTGGSPDAWRRATKGRTGPEAQLEHEDPHWAHPIGYQHSQSPRWKRTSESTWSLDGATWSWNGIVWEGGGSAEGRTIDLPVSPGHTASDMRPLQPSKAVKR